MSARSGYFITGTDTGIGKTVACLYPAVRYALAENQRIFVLTAKTLQQEMAIEVLKLLNQEEAFRSLRLRAKGKMCANDQVICHEEYCDYARDYFLKLQQSGITRQLLDRYPTLLPDDIFATARRTEVCPFEVSLELLGLLHQHLRREVAAPGRRLGRQVGADLINLGGNISQRPSRVVIQRQRRAIIRHLVFEIEGGGSIVVEGEFHFLTDLTQHVGIDVHVEVKATLPSLVFS